MTSTSLLALKELSFDRFGPFALALQPGECIGLSGPSGSGKTRLLRAIADLDAHRGRMCLDGVACEDIPGPDWRRQVGLLPAESAWWHDEVGAHFASPPGEDCLGALGFDREALGWRVERLSSGEKQRLALLRLLAVEPRVLLLDEPTANLDEDNIARVESVIEDYRRQSRCAVLWVGHDSAQLRRIAGRRLRMSQGRLIEIREAA